MPGRPCPTPGKRRYRDGIAAKLALASTSKRRHMRVGVEERRAYHCPCGKWHLTSWGEDPLAVGDAGQEPVASR